MSPLLIIVIVILALDSIWLMYAVYKQKWVGLAIGVAIGVLLDVLIFKNYV